MSQVDDNLRKPVKLLLNETINKRFVRIRWLGNYPLSPIFENPHFHFMAIVPVGVLDAVGLKIPDLKMGSP